MRQADPFVKDRRGRTPLEYAKDKIKDTEWLATITVLIEDAMEINKTCG